MTTKLPKWIGELSKEGLRHYIRFVILWILVLIISGIIWIIYSLIGLFKWNYFPEFMTAIALLLATFLLYIKILEWENAKTT